MHKIEVKPARRYCCGRMARLVINQAGDRLGTGSSHRSLVERFEESSVCRALYVDDRLVALGGLRGSLLSISAVLWLAIAPFPKTALRPVLQELHRQLEDCAKTRSQIFSTLVVGDKISEKFAQYFGFVPINGLIFPSADPGVDLFEIMLEVKDGLFSSGRRYR